MQPMSFLALCCLTGLLLPLLAPFYGGAGHAAAWLVDLATHWQWLFLGGLIGSGMVAVRADRRWLVALLASVVPTRAAPPPTRAPAASPVSASV